ncbi:hypothetical protein TVAG_000740 [Trichomonas vaginalis G3]|uniref:G domain-containing protein n=1 Tax=Trichomonas vaginalis (strain ATCC PRA-98 / G3) TaxID=412133 RepID=A2EHV0_TRIV3|nr:GTP-binding protein-related family [Trichomonas vaginalis G3]EAY07790.1 hypothetical protein TVAG_000740 [Trichomonas vaginalis G3]KAI5542935.1 GTP-binding protein-related family [Trichomonas vaginalis G3]|eukprot:XP_001320013.1 hypothetical protein [Trichomonas vaginalis G3]
MFKDKQKPVYKHVRQNSGRIQKISKAPNPALKKYMDIIEEFTKSEKIIIMLDSRAPQAGRYTQFEKLFPDKVIYVLNKIDLIPREMALGWLLNLRSTVPTFALSSLKTAEPLIEYLKAGNVKKICITGLKNSGKHTLLKYMTDFDAIVTPDWTFLETTFEHAIIGAVEVNQKSTTNYEHLMMFIDQCSTQSLMEVFGLTYISVTDSVLQVVANDGDTVLQAGMKLFSQIRNGLWNFYSPAPTKTYSQESFNSLPDSQKRSLRYSTPYDAMIKPSLAFIEPNMPNELQHKLLKALENLEYEM